MDLGIAGRRAILLGSTSGLGLACAHSLVREGVHVVLNGRDEQRLDAAIADVAGAVGGGASSVEVIGIAGDSTEAETQQRLLAACPEPDIVLINAAGPPPTRFVNIDDDALRDSYERAVVGPLRLLRAVVPGMRERKFGRIVAITSAMVKSPNPVMGLSVGPRIGLTGIFKSLSKEVVADNVTVNLLLPERFDTPRQQYMAEVAMKARGVTYDEARAEQVASIKAGRLGRPEELGDTFAFICSAQAGYLSGQSIQLDGGSYEGVF